MWLNSFIKAISSEQERWLSTLKYLLCKHEEWSSDPSTDKKAGCGPTYNIAPPLRVTEKGRIPRPVGCQYHSKIKQKSSTSRFIERPNLKRSKTSDRRGSMGIGMLTIQHVHIYPIHVHHTYNNLLTSVSHKHDFIKLSFTIIRWHGCHIFAQPHNWKILFDSWIPFVSHNESISKLSIEIYQKST